MISCHAHILPITEDLLTKFGLHINGDLFYSPEWRLDEWCRENIHREYRLKFAGYEFTGVIIHVDDPDIGTGYYLNTKEV